MSKESNPNGRCLTRRDFVCGSSLVAGTTALSNAAVRSKRQTAVPSSPQKHEATNIGSRLELFVDDWLIDHRSGLSLKMHPPVPREVVLEFNRPWEGPLSLPANVLEDGGRFKMWYGARSQGGPSGQGRASHTAYAESEDGIHWERPVLDIAEINGSKHNNVVGFDTDDTHLGSVYQDENPQAGPKERYKAWTVRRRENGCHWIRGFISQDGLNWKGLSKDPLITPPASDRWCMFDGENAAFWDKTQGRYVAYLRGWQPVRGNTYSDLRGGVRSIRRTTSLDFRNWSELSFIDMGDAPQEHLYKHTCTPYFRAPHIYLMFPWRFVPERKFDPDWSFNGLSETVFMTSRDGIHWDRRFMEAFLRPGPDALNWTDRNMMMTRGILQTSPTELSVYYGEHYRHQSCRARRATLRVDGFVSVNASYSGGEFLTRPLTFSGEELVINYSTSTVGSIRVEIQDGNGKPLNGYGLSEASEIFGDEIERTVVWKQRTRVGDLAGRPVRLRFVMKDADLYSIRFRATE